MFPSSEKLTQAKFYDLNISHFILICFILSYLFLIFFFRF